MPDEIAEALSSVLSWFGQCTSDDYVDWLFDRKTPGFERWKSREEAKAIFSGVLSKGWSAIARHSRSGGGDGYCRDGDRCVCGGDLPRVRAGCHNWVSTLRGGGGEHAAGERLVAFLASKDAPERIARTFLGEPFTTEDLILALRDANDVIALLKQVAG